MSRRWIRLESACAVAGFDDADDYAVLDLLDALVRKSLLVADRSSGRTRFSMLQTIREFAEEQLVARGEEDQARTAHARYFAGRETDILALWDSLRQREAHDWFTRRLGAVDPDWLSAAIPLLAPAGKPRETMHRPAIGLSRAVRHRNERSRSDPTGTDPAR